MRACVCLVASAALYLPALLRAQDNCFYDASGNADKLKIGYTDGNMSLSLGQYLNLVIQGAVEFPESYMERLKGNRITALRLAIASELTQQDNYVFITDDLNGPFLYKQKVEHLNAGWNEIPLDVPFEINGPLYIGFRYVSYGERLSMDGREDNDLANWIRFTQSEDDPQSAWQHQSGGNLNFQAIVEGDNLPQHDVELQKLVAKKYAQTGGDMPISLVVRNQAAADINSLEVSCAVDGQEPVTLLVDNLNIASGDMALVPVGNIVIQQDGIANLDVKIEKVNGQDDENMADNSATLANVISKKEYVNRKTLLEHFSTMKCPNCPDAHKMMEDALAYRDDVIHVIHHTGMGTDPLTIAPSSDYMLFYTNGSSGSYYAPAAMLDRTNLSVYGANDGQRSTPGPVFFPQRKTFGKLVDRSLSTHAYVTVGIDRQYDPQTRMINVSVSGAVPSGDLARLSGDNVRLHIFVTEDGVLSYMAQAGASEGKDYVHNNVLRQVLTETWGDAITFSEDGTYASGNYSYTIPEGSDAEKMHIIAFLANVDTSNPNNDKVCNANETDITGGNSTGLESVSGAEPDIRVFVSGDYMRIAGDYENAKIYNISGQLVKVIAGQVDLVPLDDIAHGVYVVRVNSSKGVSVAKVML